MNEEPEAQIGYDSDTETFRSFKPATRFWVWKGRDTWHRTHDVQIRLEEDGTVYLGSQEGHVSTLRSAEITIEELHVLIRKTIEEKNRNNGKDLRTT